MVHDEWTFGCSFWGLTSLSLLGSIILPSYNVPVNKHGGASLSIDINCRDTKAGNHQEKGWPNSAYGMSKLGVTAYTPHQQAAFDKDSRDDIVVNAVST